MEKYKILSSISEVLREREDILFISRGGRDGTRRVFPKVFLCHLICLPKGFGLMGEIDASLHAANQSFIFKGNQPLCVQGFLVSPVFICNDSEIMLEKTQMKTALDPIFFPEVIDENEMMHRVDDLTKKIIPVSTNINKKIKNVLTVSKRGNSQANHPPSMQVYQE